MVWAGKRVEATFPSEPEVGRSVQKLDLSENIGSAAQSTRLQTGLYRRRYHSSTISGGGTHRPLGGHACASVDREGYPVVWSGAARHQSSPRRDALL